MKFTVHEAIAQDVGRGIARIGIGLMRSMDIASGDIILIKGRNTGYARVMPSSYKNGEDYILRIDGIIRNNAGVGLGEQVEVEKASLPDGKMVVLRPLERFVQREVESRYLNGLPVQRGDHFRLNLFGRQHNFEIIDSTPKLCIIRDATILKIEGMPLQTSGGKGGFLSYEDVGGLKPQLQKIREMIELPIRYPELFERVGVDPPKGLLLYGPPGTGKTRIAKAVAHEVNAHFISVSGPEIVGKFYGESEAKIRQIFETATRNAPSIIFLDEIDAIAPKREDVGGEKQVERRMVAQLLALMDGLQDRGQVIVIAATNMPDLLDPALRRPGRFDREIEIAIPDREGREEILTIHTRGMPLEEDVQLHELAARTHGYVGADLAALCREAAMHALRKFMPRIDFSLEYIPYDLLEGLSVSAHDFAAAFQVVNPSALREFFIEIPDTRWDDIGGHHAVKEKIRDAVELPLKKGDLFSRVNIRPPTGILLYGPPGTGKTLIAKALAHETRSNFISVKGPQLISKYVGESERALREVFRKARAAAPCIIFFDEFDSISPERGRSGDSGVTERMISQLLTEMDGIEEMRGVVVLAATNRLDIIDPALLRPGRFDHIIELPLPDMKDRKEIFQVHLRNMPLAEEISVDHLVDSTDACSGADIDSVCRTAAFYAIKEFGDRDPDSFRIENSHFERALEELYTSPDS